MKDLFFNCFASFWNHTHNMDDFQRKIIFDSLSSDEKIILLNELKKDNWEDLIFRNKLDNAIDELYEIIGINLLEIKSRALNGEKVTIDCSIWEYCLDYIESITKNIKHTRYILGGISWKIQGVKTIIEKDKHGKKYLN